MAKGHNDEMNNSSLTSNNSDPNNSLLKKVTRRVSDFIPSSLTRWFAPNSENRRRERNEDAEEMQIQEPPKKRIKHSADGEFSASENFLMTSTPLSNSRHELNNLMQPGPSGYTREIKKTSCATQYDNDITSTDFQSLSQPGTSGTSSSESIKNRHDKTAIVNGDDRSDSGDSTSGYSSLPLPQQIKERINTFPTASSSSAKTQPFHQSKPLSSSSPSLVTNVIPTSTSPRSLFSDPQMHRQRQCLNNRRPAFNVTTFGAPNFVDRTLTSKYAMNSPFYVGKTTYGGASAYRQRRLSFPRDDSSLAGAATSSSSFIASTCSPNSVTIKPVNNDDTLKSNATLSRTARRILDSFQYFTTPYSDAKNIPNIHRPNQNFNRGQRVTPYQRPPPPTLQQQQQQQQQKAVPSATSTTTTSPSSLQNKINNSASLSKSAAPIKQLLCADNNQSLMKMKQKERLQDSTEEVRKVAIASKAILNSTDSSNNMKRSLENVGDTLTKRAHTGKMKTKISVSHRGKNTETIDIVDPVQLPDVHLPITNLPKFDFTVPALNPNNSNINSSKSNLKVDNKHLTTPIASTSSSSFSFNNSYNNKEKTTMPEAKTQMKTTPITMATTTTTTVKTSSPLNNKNNDDSSQYKFAKPIIVSEKMSKSITSINNFKFSEPIDMLLNTSKPMVAFKYGDNSTAPKRKESPVCVKNNGQSVTGFTLPAAKELVQGSVMDILGKSSFDLSPSSKSNLLKKSDTNSLITTTTTIKSAAAASSSGGFSGFGDKFKPTAGSWECDACLVRNKSDAVKCISCTTPKPGSVKKSEAPVAATTTSTMKPFAGFTNFGDKFKPAEGSWECNACLVRNNSDVTKCVSCTTPKPGGGNSTAAVAKTTTSNSLPSITFSGFGDKFKPIEGSWECTTCLVRNNSDATKCISCTVERPGGSGGVKTDFNFNKSNGTPVAKKQPVNWECTSCLVRNAPEKATCVCCDAKRPTDKNQIFSFDSVDSKNNNNSTPQFKFGISPSATPVAASSTPANTGFTFGVQSTAVSTSTTFSFGFKPTSTANEATKTTSTPASSSSQLSTTTPKTGTPAPVTSGFTFGVQPIVANKTEITTVPSATASSSLSVTKTPEKSTGFSFGTYGSSKSDTKLEQKQPVMTFGAIKSNDNSKITTTPQKTSTISFGTAAAATSTKPQEEENNKGTAAATSSTTTNLFGFGTTAPTTSTVTSTNIMAPKSGFSFGLTTTSEAAQSSSAPVTTNTSTSTPSNTNVIFGAKPKSDTPTAGGSFNFGTPKPLSFGTPKPLSFGTPKPLSFGTATAAAATSTSTTDAEDKTKINSFPVPQFNFGGSGGLPFSTVKPSTSSDTNNTNNNNNGAVTTNTSAIAVVPPTSNNTSTINFNQPTVFGSSGNNNNSNADAPSSSTSSSIFGSSGTKPSFNFINNNNNNNNTEKSAEVKPFSFISNTSAAAGSAAPKTSEFLFAGASKDQSSQQQLAKAPVFNFGSSSSTATSALVEPVKPLAQTSTATSNLFNFGSNNNNNNKLEQKASTSIFGSNTVSSSNTPAAAPSATANTSLFGQNLPSSSSSSVPQNGGFNFGAAPQSLTPNFNFTTSTPPVAAPTPQAPSIFAFGSNQAGSGSANNVVAPAAPSGVFTFGANAPSQSSATSAFCPDVKPNFNFNAGNTVSQFTAQGGPPTGLGQRKIRKAIRRTQPR